MKPSENNESSFAVMEHFICGKQIHGHRNHGHHPMVLLRLVDNII